MATSVFIFDSTHRNTKYGNAVRTAGTYSRTTGGNTVTLDVAANADDDRSIPWFQLDDDGDSLWSDLLAAYSGGGSIDDVTADARCLSTASALNIGFGEGRRDLGAPTSATDEDLLRIYKSGTMQMAAATPADDTDFSCSNDAILEAIINALDVSETFFPIALYTPDASTDVETTVLDTDGTPSSARVVITVTYTPGSSGPANVASVNGVAKANIASINGVALADIASINGVA